MPPIPVADPTIDFKAVTFTFPIPEEMSVTLSDFNPFASTDPVPEVVKSRFSQVPSKVDEPTESCLILIDWAASPSYSKDPVPLMVKIAFRTRPEIKQSPVLHLLTVASSELILALNEPVPETSSKMVSKSPFKSHLPVPDFLMLIFSCLKC